jgi:membrane-bound lytic murein transglycosylase B
VTHPAASVANWRRAGASVLITVLVAASSCSGRPPDAEGIVPPPPGEAVPAVDTTTRGHPADQLRTWADTRAPLLGMPVRALQAYAYAAEVAGVVNPRCHLGWTTLAAIGYVESRHGTFGGATINADGDVRPPIRGVGLDGTDGNEMVLDDESRTGDDGYVHAMGPMQFIPETWREYGVDAHNNGISSPDNIDDAALSAAGYLCARGGDLATHAGWIRAILSYNDSGIYVRAIRDWATAYGTGHAP